MTCLSRLNPLPPPHASPGAILARPVPLPPPSTLLGLAYDIIFDNPHPFRCILSIATPMRSQEETKLNNFLLYGFLIESLGAEQSAPKDRRKFSKYMRPPKILRSA